MTRRRFLAVSGAAALAGFSPILPNAVQLSRPALAQGRKRYRMLLNTSFSGPQAFLLLAQDRGYFAEEGLEVEYTQGSGAYTAAPRLFAGGFDFAHGDINALIEVASANPGAAPAGVFASFNASPSTIAVRADGPVRTPKDFEGRVIAGHGSDVALRTFGAFCKSAGVNQGKVTVRPFAGGFRGEIENILASDAVHGLFGYVSTIAAALAEGGKDINARVRHFRFAQHVPDLYGSVVMASRKALEDRAAVSGLVRAINRGLHDAVRDPAAGIDAVMRRVPHADRAVERLRLNTTYEIEMAHSEGKRIGLGAVDEARLTRAIALIADTNGLRRRPALEEIFVPDFLPPVADRVRSLAR
ncbi:MAG: ABC transporter substrate-binding protein [Beijerinckiaceae bacterium]